MNKHYHVFVEMPGYLPENEPEIYPTRKQAEAAAKWHADGYRDMIADSQPYPTAAEWQVTGSARSGRYTVERGPYALPTYITIATCDDATCEQES